MSDALRQLSDAGVSIWLDDLDRTRISTGGLAKLVRGSHVTGVTTNPTIFAKALHRSEAYAGQLADLALRGVEIGEALRALTTWDVRAACDVLREVYDATGGVDGRVSIEVDPRLAHDTERTIAEARALWWLVDRPNLLIKIPATREGLPAISAVLAEGISVNVTLIFARQRYREVIDAFFTGLERRRAAGGELDELASVASFFVSRVDTEVDHRLDLLAKEADPERAVVLSGLRGRAAIANARLAYQEFTESLATERWAALVAAGAHCQRPLWASTGVKDPAYPDTRYVTELVAAHCVNTMPEPTLAAVADHGVIPAGDLAAHAESDRRVLAELATVGVDLDEVTEFLEVDGVRKFQDSWAELIGVVEAELGTAR